MTSMDEENIKEIINSFATALVIYDSPNWAKTVTAEEIKIAFKLYFFLETVAEKLAAKNCFHGFLEVLKITIQNNHFCHEEQFYKVMCDHLLLKFFKAPNLNENIADVAVRMYTSLLPKDRLNKCLKHFILNCGCIEAIQNFMHVIGIVPIELKCHEILNDWSGKVKAGEQSEIETHIKNNLAIYKLEETLPYFIVILGLTAEGPVVNIILDSILDKMMDRSILSKKFWLILLRNIPKEHLKKVCLNHKTFLESLCGFIIYIGTMMDKDSTGNWISNHETCFCPEINYEELESLIRYLRNVNSDVERLVDAKLLDGKRTTDAIIWDEIIEKFS